MKYKLKDLNFNVKYPKDVIKIVVIIFHYYVKFSQQKRFNFDVVLQCLNTYN